MIIGDEVVAEELSVYYSEVPLYKEVVPCVHYNFPGLGQIEVHSKQ